MIITPDYYPLFSCKAGECRHSCCKGWEIDIDEDSLLRYMTLEGTFGDKLRKNIEKDTYGAHFILLGEEERCPFLLENGLCEMILTTGEGSLCQICTDHPRYRSSEGSNTLLGVGLCCEAAAELILNRADKMRLIDNSGNTVRDADASRRAVCDVLQDRDFTMLERFENVLDLIGADMPERSFSEWCGYYMELEIMDSAWAELIEAAQNAPENGREVSETALEQLAVYFLYRHFADGYEDGSCTERVLFAIHAAMFIRDLYAHTDIELCELARLYSSEIEYSDENLPALIDEMLI